MSRAPGFRSLREAQGKRKSVWICPKCLGWVEAKPARNKCAQCGVKPCYFPSKKEARRYLVLRMRLRLGLIDRLVTQPTYEVVVSGEHICNARYDFRYVRLDGDHYNLEIVEDVKASKSEKSLDPVWKLKRKLVEALHPVHITIVTNENA